MPGWLVSAAIVPLEDITVTKLDRYTELNRYGKEVAWIAGCFMKPGYAIALRKLYDIVKAGHDVCGASFSMPYESIMVNGDTITYSEFLNWSAPVTVSEPAKAILLFTW